MQPLNPEDSVTFGLVHTSGKDIQWWTLALERVSAHRAEGSPCIEAFGAFLSRFLRRDDTNATGFDLSALSRAQKWVLLVTLDEFLDQNIISHDSVEEWIAVWEKAAESYACAYAYLAGNPDSVDGAELEAAWLRLRLAAS